MATANAASGRETRRAHKRPPDLTGWAREVALLGVDVLAVQEVDHLLPRSGGADQTATLAGALTGDGPPWQARFAAAVHGTPGHAATMRSAPSTDLAEPSYGIALLSRHPVREWHELRMAPASLPMPVPDEQRVALAAEVVAPGGMVSVVGTHLSFVPWRAAVQLRALVAWAHTLPRPLLLLGDLNLPGRLPADLTGWASIGAGPTYPAARPVVQLDHALLDPGESDLSLGRATTHKLAGSDHLALRAELGRFTVVSRHDRR